MAQSLARNLIHLIYSTKHREPLLIPAIHPKLFAYQAGVLRECDSPAIVIGGDVDHIHALFILSKNRTLCDVIESVKKTSSKWIKTQGSSFAGFHWQNGYGAFSVSQSQVSRVRQYIVNQQTHHRAMTFQDEFRLFLKRYGIEHDELYVWD